MSDEIIFRQIKPGQYTIRAATFNEDYVEYLKARVPARNRSYDGDGQQWTVTVDEKTLNAITSVACQRFRYAQLRYRNKEGKLVLKNLHTGQEAVQEELFDPRVNRRKSERA